MAEPVNGDEPARDPRWRLSPTKIVVGIVLLVAIVVPLLVPTYSRVDPKLWGFPFFYWYQLLWVFLCSGLVGICYLLIRREERRYAAAHPRPNASTQAARRMADAQQQAERRHSGEPRRASQDPADRDAADQDGEDH